MHDYHVVDVFTQTRFGGNPLAVVLDADDLSGDEMQRIAREFNFSETSFVLRPDDPAHVARVRIFTPVYEMPFAGHPNVGTAFVLAKLGVITGARASFEQKAGPVEIATSGADGLTMAIRAPEALSLGAEVQAEAVAAAVSLPVEAILTATHKPVVASVGASFVVAEVAGREALAAAKADPAAQAVLKDGFGRGSVYLYSRDLGQNDGAADWSARMFSASDSREDPATGSASGAAAALAHRCGLVPKDGAAFRLVQGVDMGRPSAIEVRVGEDGVTIGGNCVPVMSGRLEI